MSAARNFNKVTERKLSTLPQWAQEFVQRVREVCRQHRTKCVELEAQIEQLERNERNIRLELDRARRRIAELESR